MSASLSICLGPSVELLPPLSEASSILLTRGPVVFLGRREEERERVEFHGHFLVLELEWLC